MKKLSVSIVIPVYNEAAYLGACLEAIAAQTVPADEVIVVDNNSTDDTLAVAARYPFVQVLHQPRQGVVYARNLGFDTASGDIIGRIDADSVLSSDWVATLQQIFTDQTVSAVSGSITYHDIPFRDFFHKVELFFRQWVANGLGEEGFLYGGNMGIRRRSWQQARGQLCSGSGLHEDLDLGVHAAAVEGKVIFDKRVHVLVSLRRYDTNFDDFWQWVWLSPGTYLKHGCHKQRRMNSVALLAIIFYLPVKLLHAGYNGQTERFSWRHLLLASPPPGRVNPALFVD